MTALDALVARCREPRGPAVRIPGFNRAHLPQLFAECGFRRGAEIGVARGAFSELLCQTIPGLHVLCVDPWCRYPGNRRAHSNEEQERCRQIALERLKPYDVTIVRAKSAEAARDVPLESLDFVFIDGNHAYAFVLEDLTLWSARVRRGGIVSGDDYYHFPKAGVVEAVNDYTEAHDITSWWITDDRYRRNYRGARQPAFLWVKP